MPLITQSLATPRLRINVENARFTKKYALFAILNAVSTAEVLVVIRPEDILLSATAPADQTNSFVVKVSNRIFLGDVIDDQVAFGGEEFRVRSHPEWDFNICEDPHPTIPTQNCGCLAANANEQESAAA